MITWNERPNSIRLGGNPKTLTIGYLLTGVTNATYARAQGIARSAALYGDLYRSDVAVEEVGPGNWNVDVEYGTEDKKEPESGEYKWQFDTSGGTKHITQGLAHINSYVPTDMETIDHDGAIGVKDDGTVEGCDVPDYHFSWSETCQLLIGTYGGFAYALTVAEISGKVNSASFRGLPAGTVLLRGAQGGQSSKDPNLMEITFSFEYSPDVTNQTIGSITGVAKKGWQFASIRHEMEEDSTAKKNTQKVRQVDIDKVIEEANFALLGIGS